MNENFLKNLTVFSNQKLCEIIVCARYLGSMKEEAILCMQELAKRRNAGDNFDFETEINEGIKKLPNFKTDVSKIIKNLDLSIFKESFNVEK